MLQGQLQATNKRRLRDCRRVGSRVCGYRSASRVGCGDTATRQLALISRNIAATWGDLSVILRSVSLPSVGFLSLTSVVGVQWTQHVHMLAEPPIDRCSQAFPTHSPLQSTESP